MMSKKFITIAPLAILALTSSLAFAADSSSHSINIAAHVPAATFYVVPVDSSLVNSQQRMDFNPATGNMDKIKGYFDIRSSSGAVQASLVTTPKLMSGADAISLQVEFNNIVLNTIPQTVVSAVDALTSYRAPLSISATDREFNPGDYTGTVAMVFDAVSP